jgi:hypothetical protein
MCSPATSPGDSAIRKLKASHVLRGCARGGAGERVEEQFILSDFATNRNLRHIERFVLSFLERHITSMAAQDSNMRIVRREEQEERVSNSGRNAVRKQRERVSNSGQNAVRKLRQRVSNSGRNAVRKLRERVRNS